ncbi:MAG: hypothetical protein BWY89_01294 [Bacteroidetes bacterium ADurb.BinA012]|nr:MAG: hypothetical protein BWY89_01294 [Bacteroidetes bacterium ADurb.BinA012]
MHLHGYPAAVVHNGYGVIFVDCHIYTGAVSREGFINGIVNNLIYKMMQPPCANITDIHGGPLPYSFQALKNLDAVS